MGTVQEEVGLRGATTSVELVKPDVAIVLEADIAGDVPGIKPEDCATKLGKGPALVVYDARMIPNAKLRRLVMETARGERHSAAAFRRWRAAAPTAAPSTSTPAGCRRW